MYTQAIDRDLAHIHDLLSTRQAALAQEYAQILCERCPSLGQAWMLLAAALQGQGDTEAAVSPMMRAAQLLPGVPEVQCNLGAVYFAVKRFADAAQCYQNALVLRPRDAAVAYFLANTWIQLNRMAEAEACFQQAIEWQPGFIEARFNLAKLLRQLGRVPEAQSSYYALLMIAPRMAQAHYALGEVLQGQGVEAAAEKSYQSAIACDPKYADAHNNLGVLALNREDFAIAKTHFDAAIAIDPLHAHALLNIGRLLKAMGDAKGSSLAYRKTVEAALKKLVAVDPNSAGGHCNLGVFYASGGLIDQALVHFRRSVAIQPDYFEAQTNVLFALAYGAKCSPQVYLQEAQQWEFCALPEAIRHAARTKKLPLPPRPGRKLRVGYVSGDFRQHAVSYFFEPILAHHDRQKVEVFCYATIAKGDAVTERLRASADHWRVIEGGSDEAVCQTISVDGIDVLIDLCGHTGNHRLGVFAHRAAPVQAHYLGYFASTGLTEMDYWLGDAALIPPEAESHFSETVWRLPRTWVSYDARNDAPAVAWQPDTQGVCRLGSFNALPKLSDQTLALWARVLKLIPHACLLLKANALDEGDNRERLEEKFLKLGIAAHRLELHGFSASWRDHMDLYNRVDLALDPVGAHAGVTTTCDALWMGAPVISLAGDRMAQRQGASLLTALGHPEWVADSEDAYVAKVVALANDLPLRQTLRPAQRALMQSSALCDAKGLARELENAYEAMLQRRREQTFLTEA